MESSEREERDGRIGGDLQEVVRDIVPLRILLCTCPLGEMLDGCKGSRTGVQGSSMREEKDRIEGVVQLRANNIDVRMREEGERGRTGT